MNIADIFMLSSKLPSNKKMSASHEKSPTEKNTHKTAPLSSKSPLLFCDRGASFFKGQPMFPPPVGDVISRGRFIGSTQLSRWKLSLSRSLKQCPRSHPSGYLPKMMTALSLLPPVGGPLASLWGNQRVESTWRT